MEGPVRGPSFAIVLAASGAVRDVAAMTQTGESPILGGRGIVSRAVPVDSSPTAATSQRPVRPEPVTGSWLAEAVSRVLGAALVVDESSEATVVELEAVDDGEPVVEVVAEVVVVVGATMSSFVIVHWMRCPRPDDVNTSGWTRPVTRSRQTRLAWV